MLIKSGRYFSCESNVNVTKARYTLAVFMKLGFLNKVSETNVVYTWLVMSVTCFQNMFYSWKHVSRNLQQETFDN